jgi:hypothetical protein
MFPDEYSIEDKCRSCSWKYKDSVGCAYSCEGYCDWNCKFSVGDVVDFHSVIGGKITSRYHIIEWIGEIPSHDHVARITGKDGVVSLDALSINPEWERQEEGDLR